MTPPKYQPPASVRDNQHARALARRPQPCGNGVGRGLTCDQYGTHLYTVGWRCPRCATAAGLALPTERTPSG